MKRTIIFGDIHGCYQEWQDLMDKIQVTESDQLISVGDIVCKGPSTRKSLDLAMSLPNLKCVIGNHEQHLLNAWNAKTLDSMRKDYQTRAVEELGEDIDRYMEFIQSWPYYLEFEDFIVLHAGIRAEKSLAEQDIQDLVALRTVGDDDHPWHDDYKESKLIVHGHWARQGLKIKDNVIGLDSGCVYGKELTAVILPERTIVSVPAREVYVPVSND